MDYLELMDMQERIVDYEKKLKEKISFLDSNGNRKLDPYYFLSAEVAAYKILSSWIKMMQRGQDFIDDGSAQTLDTIQVLLEEEYEDFQEYEADISMPLWYELTKSFDGDALINFNAEVVVLASLAEVAKGTPLENSLICTMSDDEFTDANLMSYAYSLAHDYLLSLSKEGLELFAKTGFGLNESKGELHKLHFNLFQ